MTRTAGLHHMTAIATDPQRNINFYAGVLGLRLVKQTVNFDDPGTYHLYYGDATGRPGSLLTFFPWPNARRGRVGAGQVLETQLAIPTAALAYWIARLTQHQVAFDGPVRRFAGESALTFTDGDGLPLALIAADAAAALPGAGGVAGVPEQMSIRGIHAVTLGVARAADTAKILTDVLGFQLMGRHDNVERYAAAEREPGAFVDIREMQAGPGGTSGAGTVHHVAFRAADDIAEHQLRTQVEAAGLPITPQIDRTYFRSMYFREPGQVLFELATDAPGFSIDEPVAQLGTTLQLPAQHEHLRASLSTRLPPLHLPTHRVTDIASLQFVHAHVPPTNADDRRTVLLLHGTGGNERDLLALGAAVAPGARLLGVRGQVLESGMPRFFRRIAEGVFDEADLRRRAADLAAFVTAAADAYGFDATEVIAVGYSNGANIAAALLLLHPGVLAGAALLRSMVPLQPESLPRLGGVPVLMSEGRRDPIVPSENAERLAALLTAAGADVTLHWEAAGHELTIADQQRVQLWMDARR